MDWVITADKTSWWQQEEEEEEEEDGETVVVDDVKEKQYSWSSNEGGGRTWVKQKGWGRDTEMDLVFINSVSSSTRTFVYWEIYLCSGV